MLSLHFTRGVMSAGRETENHALHVLEYVKFLLCKRSLTRKACRGIPPFWSQMGSSAQIAEHSKSRGIIIKAALVWTLMAASVLLPWHI